MQQSEMKRCSQCKDLKDPEDFYKCQGKIRTECKSCTIKKNVKYQKRNKTWRHRYIDPEQQKCYMSEYYQKNKERFAEYRRKFKERFPDYYKEYARKRKNEQ